MAWTTMRNMYMMIIDTVGPFDGIGFDSQYGTNRIVVLIY